MKRLLMLLLVALMVVGPVVAATSPIKTDFQDYSTITSWPTSQWDWIFGASITPYVADTYGSIDARSSGGITNANPEPFTYSAATFRLLDASRLQIRLMDASGIVIATYSPSSVSSPGRYEVIITSGIGRIYVDKNLIYTTGVLSGNPYYISYTATTYPGSLDDVIVGYSDDSNIVGAIPPNYFIKYDPISPASTGLYQTNNTFGGDPILKNSNYYGVSYGRGTNASTTLDIIDPNGVTVHSYSVANQSGRLVLPITDMYEGGVIVPGQWIVKLADDSRTQKQFWVLSGTAAVMFDKDKYGQQDSATVTYSIGNLGYDTTTYSYRLETLSIYGDVIDSQPITTRNGTKTVTFTTSDTTGVYYAAIVATKLSDSTEYWLGYDSAELTGYIFFNGYVYNGQNATAISGANVSITQGSLTSNSLTDATGAYSSSSTQQFGTGTAIALNVTATGFRQYLYSFTPTIAKTISLNFTLAPITPVANGRQIAGVFRDDVYGRPIPSATSTITNASLGTSFSKLSNSVGWYEVDLDDGVTLYNNTCYSVTGSKTRYTSDSEFKCLGV